MNRPAQILVVSLLLVGGVIPALAHHGYAAYDETVTQSLKRSEERRVGKECLE